MILSLADVKYHQLHFSTQIFFFRKIFVDNRVIVFHLITFTISPLHLHILMFVLLTKMKEENDRSIQRYYFSLILNTTITINNKSENQGA